MRALVLCSGGPRGAYEAGAIRYLLGDLSIRYDVICAAGMGAFNAIYLNTFRPGEELLASASLCKVWGSFLTPPVGVQARLFSLFRREDPVHSAILHYLGEDPPSCHERKILVGVGDVDRGSYHLIHAGRGGTDLSTIALAASTPASLSSPVRMGSSHWCDPGVRERTPVRAAVDGGATFVDVIISTPETPSLLAGPSMASDAFFFMADELVSVDVSAAIRDPNVDVRVIRPVSHPPRTTDRWHPKFLGALMRAGYDDARRAIPPQED